MSKRKVIVSGLGVVSSAGMLVNVFFENLCKGIDTTGPIATCNTDCLIRKNAAEIKVPLPVKESWRKYSQATQMALIAVQNALNDAQIKPGDLSIRTGICFSTMCAGMPEVENYLFSIGSTDVKKIPRKMLEQYSHQSVADTLAYEFNLSGICSTIDVACASGTVALGIAYRWVQRGRADVVICGGVDPFSLSNHIYLSSLRIITPDKVRPFDDKRRGTLLGEGAGVLVLESEESALKRKAKIYCQIEGYGFSCDADDLSHPNEYGSGLSRAMEKAISESNIKREYIGYINAHGTGTKKNDTAEIEAIRKTFKNSASSLCISSIKGAIGHTGAAAGAIEAIATIKALYTGRIPPTINFQNNSNANDLNFVPNRSIKSDLRYAMSNSSGMGGSNASIIFGRYCT